MLAPSLISHSPHCLTFTFKNCVCPIFLRASVLIYSGSARVRNVICATVSKRVGNIFKTFKRSNEEKRWRIQRYWEVIKVYIPQDKLRKHSGRHFNPKRKISLWYFDDQTNWRTLPSLYLQTVFWDLIFLWEQLAYSLMKKKSYFWVCIITSLIL